MQLAPPFEAKLCDDVTLSFRPGPPTSMLCLEERIPNFGTDGTKVQVRTIVMTMSQLRDFIRALGVYSTEENHG